MGRKSEDSAWLENAIRQLPSDEPVPLGTPGYNKYTTQKAHWLGWLNPAAGTGTYPRAGGRDRSARDIYNRIVEPKLLLWLAHAAEVRPALLAAAVADASTKSKLASKSAAIREHIPWTVMVEALRRKLGERVA